jgi:hypothetical protein
VIVNVVIATEKRIRKRRRRKKRIRNLMTKSLSEPKRLTKLTDRNERRTDTKTVIKEARRRRTRTGRRTDPEAIRRRRRERKGGSM